MNCGGGISEKFRICDNPTPLCGGKECSGIKVETVDCNEFSCDDEGIYACTCNLPKYIVIYICIKYINFKLAL